MSGSGVATNSEPVDEQFEIASVECFGGTSIELRAESLHLKHDESMRQDLDRIRNLLNSAGKKIDALHRFSYDLSGKPEHPGSFPETTNFQQMPSSRTTSFSHVD